MSHFTRLAGMARDVARIKLARMNEPQPIKYRNANVPLNLSQDAVVTINTVPLIIARASGALIRDVAENHTIGAVGKSMRRGATVFRSYLAEGAYIESSYLDDPTKLLSLQLFAPYFEVTPPPPAGMDFYLDESDGYIGYPAFQSTDQDGKILYQRHWASGDQRIAPEVISETILDSAGNSHTVRHDAMCYARRLNGDNAPLEYLLVSAIDRASVAIWLGLDIAQHDLTVLQST